MASKRAAPLQLIYAWSHLCCQEGNLQQSMKDNNTVLHGFYGILHVSCILQCIVLQLEALGCMLCTSCLWNRDIFMVVQCTLRNVKISCNAVCV